VCRRLGPGRLFLDAGKGGRGPNPSANLLFYGPAWNRAEIHALIQASITRNLASKGVAKVDNGGDITVAYLVVIGSNVTTAAIGDYFGYGPETSALLDKAHKGASKQYDAFTKRRIRDEKTYLAGALVLDVLDARTIELQYRNFAYRDLLRQAPKDVRAERIQEVVDEVLGGLRVAPAR
jgi:hypothetical protein